MEQVYWRFGLIINYILKSLSINFSFRNSFFGLFICWIVMNIGITVEAMANFGRKEFLMEFLFSLCLLQMEIP